jgi:hypothetical protein
VIALTDRRRELREASVRLADHAAERDGWYRREAESWLALGRADMARLCADAAKRARRSAKALRAIGGVR